MGAHFAPPFDILTLHKIESEALQFLKEEHKIAPPLFARFIDDILTGSFNYEISVFDKILTVFNSINTALQFTIEVPQPSSRINFLDISVWISDHTIKHIWYSKESHSEITLNSDSWLPRHRLKLILLAIVFVKSLRNAPIPF